MSLRNRKLRVIQDKLEEWRVCPSKDTKTTMVEESWMGMGGIGKRVVEIRNPLVESAPEGISGRIKKNSGETGKLPIICGSCLTKLK